MPSLSRTLARALLVVGLTSTLTVAAATVEKPKALREPEVAHLVTLAVRISSTGALAARDAYLGVIPSWRRWSMPLVEEITKTGRSTFRVPPGTYYVVCGAKGFQMVTRGPLTLRGEPGVAVDIALKPLLRVEGTIVDEHAQALPGVRIARSRDTVAPLLGKLSELAVRALASDWWTTSDVNGTWSLGVPEGKFPLLFTSEDRAAQFRFDTALDAMPLDLAMPRGSRLHLTTDRIDPFFAVTLERDGAEAAGSVPRNWQRQRWAKWVTSTSMSWDSLPEGDYSIWGKYVDPSYFMRHAIKLATVRLEAGQTVGFHVTLPPAEQASKTVARFHSVAVDPNTMTGDDLEAFGQSISGTGIQRLRCVAEAVARGVIVNVDTSGARPPFFVMTAERFIFADPDALFDSERQNSPPANAIVTMRADAYLNVQSAEQELSMPSSATATFRDCSGAIRLTVPVEIRNGNFARFTAPAGCKSGSLSFVPFEPVLLETPLRPGEQSLGDHILHARASADVRVTRDPDGSAVAGATVQVFAERADAPRELIVAGDATTAEDGWVHFDSVPTSRTLHFTAITPEGDRSAPKEARAAAHGRIILDSLRLAKPATLVVTPKIDRAVSERFPNSGVATLFVAPAADPELPTDQLQQNVPPDGSDARFERLRPGRWKVTALVRVAGTHSMVDVEDVELSSGETRHLDAVVKPLVFQGVVTDGGKGVAARVTLLDPTRPAASTQQQFDSLADGSFYAALPAPGVYKGTVVRLDAQSDDITLDDVDFTDPLRLVEIAIPPTAGITVHVQSEGQPLAKVLVTASLTTDRQGELENQKRARFSDANGQAKFEHMRTGQWLLSVRDTANMRAADKPVAVVGSDRVDVSLELEQSRTIAGSIRDPAGNVVPRARIDCMFVGPAGLPAHAAAATDAEGQFRIDAPSESSGAASCSIIAPSGSVDAFRAQPSDDPLNVILPAATATVQIADWGKRFSPDAFWLVASDGRTISLSAVAETLGGRLGALLQIPALAAGHWRVVKIQSVRQWAALMGGQGEVFPPVADLLLDPGALQTIYVYGFPQSSTGGD